MVNQFQLPNYICMTVQRRGEEEAELTLVETYDDPAIAARTVEAMKANDWDCILKDDNTLELRLVSSVGTIGNMMASESLIWSSMGEMTFRDLLGMLGMKTLAPDTRSHA